MLLECEVGGVSQGEDEDGDKKKWQESMAKQRLIK